MKNSQKLGVVDLIIPIWSSARSSHQLKFGNMTKLQGDGLIKLIANGCGLAGWHGHMGDAFRDRPTYHFLIGGQFVATLRAGLTTKTRQLILCIMILLFAGQMILSHPVSKVLNYIVSNIACWLTHQTKY